MKILRIVIYQSTMGIFGQPVNKSPQENQYSLGIQCVLIFFFHRQRNCLSARVQTKEQLQ